MHVSQYLRDWYGVAPPSDTAMSASMMAMMDMPMMHGLMPNMNADMMALQSKSGSDFEIAFMSDMSAHHAMAIQMAGPVLMEGHHADLYRLAESIVISQGQEIQQMQTWLNDWYQVPRPLH